MSIQSCNQEVLSAVDVREALFNGGEIGPIKHVQISTERITSLQGILFDIDPELYRESAILPQVPQVPHEFYGQVLRPWLDRHPTLAKAEVRCSGTGLHAILWFDEPLQFETAGERERWVGIVQVVQAALPVDPNQPGITAVTRPVGSINSKNNAQVDILKHGDPVTQAEVLTLYGEMSNSPFRTVMKILTGSDRLATCPVCGDEGANLSALDHIGTCYHCGKVKLEQLYDLVLAPQVNDRKEVKRNE